MARCIGRDNLEQMNDKWRAYVASLSELAHKLSTSYNIETIIEPLDVQISEAIMNFQENATNITYQIYKTCGGPGNWQPTTLEPPAYRPSGHSGRLSVNRLARRSANPMDYHKKPQTSRGQTFSNDRFKVTGFERLAQEISHRTLEQSLAQPDQKSSNLIDEIKKFASSSKLFWSSLPNSVCTSVLGLSNTTTSGTASSFRKQQPNCYSEHFSITDINSDIRYKMEISKQASYLEEVRRKIDEALVGIEVNWTSQDHQQQPQQKLPTVSNQISGGSRPVPQPPSFITSTSTTAHDDVTDEEDNDYEPVESGSGECSDEDPEGCEHDPEPETPDVTPEEPDSSTKPSIEISTPINGIDHNSIDKVNQPDRQDDNEIFITVNPGFQKSGQTSYKLVISFGGQIVLSFILSVALLFVTNLTSRTRTISIQSC